MDELGRRIRSRAAELGLTQTELARRAGVHVRQIRRYERGEQQPVLHVAVKLAQALDLSLDELAGAIGDPLNGTWWTARQVEVEGRAFVVTVDVTLTAKRDRIAVEGRGWRGELLRGDGDTLTGLVCRRARPAGDDAVRAPRRRDRARALGRDQRGRGAS